MNVIVQLVKDTATLNWDLLTVVGLDPPPVSRSWDRATSAPHTHGCHCWLVQQCERGRMVVMGKTIGHRKRVRHFDEPGHVHELTFSCYRRLPLLTNNEWRAELSVSLDRARRRHRYRLLAFVFMPEHVHLLVHAGEGASGIPALLKAIKRPFSYRIKQRLIAAGWPGRDRPGREATGWLTLSVVERGD